MNTHSTNVFQYPRINKRLPNTKEIMSNFLYLPPLPLDFITVAKLTRNEEFLQ